MGGDNVIPLVISMHCTTYQTFFFKNIPQEPAATTISPIVTPIPISKSFVPRYINFIC